MPNSFFLESCVNPLRIIFAGGNAMQFDCIAMDQNDCKANKGAGVYVLYYSSNNIAKAIYIGSSRDLSFRTKNLLHNDKGHTNNIVLCALKEYLLKHDLYDLGGSKLSLKVGFIFCDDYIEREKRLIKKFNPIANANNFTIGQLYRKPFERTVN